MRTFAAGGCSWHHGWLAYLREQEVRGAWFTDEKTYSTSETSHVGFYSNGWRRHQRVQRIHGKTVIDQRRSEGLSSWGPGNEVGYWYLSEGFSRIFFAMYRFNYLRWERKYSIGLRHLRWISFIWLLKFPACLLPLLLCSILQVYNCLRNLRKPKNSEVSTYSCLSLDGFSVVTWSWHSIWEIGEFC